MDVERKDCTEMPEFNQDAAVFQLDLDARKFDSAAKKAQKTFAKFADATNEKIATVRQQFSNYMINDLAGNAIKNAFESSFDFLSNFANQSKELVKIADASNISVEALSKLQAVSKETEVDLQTLADASNALSFDALNESAAELGLNVDALDKQGSAETFAAVVDALKELPSAEQRAASGAKIFGDSFESLAPILDGTSGSLRDAIQAAKDAGLVASDDAARGAAEFADALEKLKDVATGLGNAVAVALLPIIQECAENLTGFVHWVGSIASPANEADAQIAALARSTKAAREEFEKLKQGDAEDFAFVQDLAGQGELTAETFEKAASVVERLQKKYGDLGLSVDAATRSIEAAADAQERFDKAAKEKEREALQKELDAAVENKKSLDEQAQRKLKHYEGFWGGLGAFTRQGFSKLGIVDSAVENREKEMGKLGDASLEESKHINELRKRLAELDADDQKEESTPRDQNEQPVEKSETTEKTETPPSVPIEQPGEKSEKPPVESKTNFGSSFSQKESRLDAEISQFETRVQRAERSDDQNAIADVRKEEADYRSKLDARIVEERSKGKSGQDESLIESFLQKREESLQREEERVQKIKSEVDSEIEQTAWSQATTPQDENVLASPEQNPVEIDPELTKIVDAIQKEAEEYKSLLEKGVELAETPEQREKYEALLAELPEKVDERIEGATADFNAEKQAEAFAELQREWEKEGFPEGMDADPFGALLEEAAKAADESIQGTPATFSAFDAANAAAVDLDEKALKEAQRQTRILEEIRRLYQANQVAAFV